MEKNNSKSLTHIPRYFVEPAKTGRSRCRGCNYKIDKHAPRVGCVLYEPHRTVLWYHLDPACVFCEELSVSTAVKDEDRCVVEAFEEECRITSLPVLTGKIGLKQLAGIMTGRYNKFRSFSFGISGKYYTPNWNWRCLMATILVCNTKELYMLDFVQKLFKQFTNPEELVLMNQEQKIKIVELMKKHKIKHEWTKLTTLINASRMVIDKGGVPATREELMSIKGIGRHVSSVVMAWVHRESTFGIDLHVRRILKRFRLLTNEKDAEIEARVAREVPSEMIGKFSRTFVDMGQSVCGYTRNCHQCAFKKSCPSSLLEW